MSDESPTVGPTSEFGLTQKQVLGHLGCDNGDVEIPGQAGLAGQAGPVPVDQPDRAVGGDPTLEHRDAGARGRQSDPDSGSALISVCHTF